MHVSAEISSFIVIIDVVAVKTTEAGAQWEVANQNLSSQQQMLKSAYNN